MADISYDENMYDTIEIEDMDFDKRTKTFYYPCPCGDKFAITIKQMLTNETVAECPSCSLKIKVVYEIEYLERYFSQYIPV